MLNLSAEAFVKRIYTVLDAQLTPDAERKRLVEIIEERDDAMNAARSIKVGGTVTA